MGIFDLNNNGYLITSTTIMGDYFVVCKDMTTNKLRLVNLDTGNILQEEFDDMMEVLKVMDLNDHVIRRKNFIID